MTDWKKTAHRTNANELAIANLMWREAKPKPSSSNLKRELEHETYFLSPCGHSRAKWPASPQEKQYSFLLRRKRSIDLGSF